MSFSVWGASSVPPTAPPRFTVRSRISSKAQFEQMRQEISARASLSSRSKKYIGAPTTLARAHGSRRFRTVVGQTMRQAPGSRTTSLERVLLNQEQHHEREKEQEKEQEKRERDEGVSGANQENELQVVPAEEPNPSSQPEVRRPHTHDPKYGGGRKYRGPVLRRWKVTQKLETPKGLQIAQRGRPRTAAGAGPLRGSSTGFRFANLGANGRQKLQSAEAEVIEQTESLIFHPSKFTTDAIALERWMALTAAERARFASATSRMPNRHRLRRRPQTSGTPGAGFRPKGRVAIEPKTSQDERCTRRLFSARLRRRQVVTARDPGWADSAAPDEPGGLRDGSLSFLSYLEEQRAEALGNLRPISTQRADALVAVAAADASSIGGGGVVSTMARVRQRLATVPRNLRELYSTR